MVSFSSLLYGSLTIVLFYLDETFVPYGRSSNHCATSIIDLHRSCPQCSYELCLSCCHDIRKGGLVDRGELKFQYENRGYDYMHGGDSSGRFFPLETSERVTEPSTVWNTSDDGGVMCPPKDLGGCNKCILELKRILPCQLISNLEVKARCLLGDAQTEQTVFKCKYDGTKDELRKAASRENTNDNYLYCPDSSHILTGGLFHFQKHWINGEPVIVRNVLEQATGLSWEPMVMWRALSENPVAEKETKFLEVKAVDCLAGCEV